MTTAQKSRSSGQGSVIPKGQKVYAKGGRLQGVGKVTRQDGSVQEFTITSDPLTQAQADQLNQKEG